jgi:hypothetical protein
MVTARHRRTWQRRAVDIATGIIMILMLPPAPRTERADSCLGTIARLAVVLAACLAIGYGLGEVLSRMITGK